MSSLIVFHSNDILFFGSSNNMLNQSLFDPAKFMKNTEIFVKSVLEDIGGNAGGIIGNVDNAGVYEAYIGGIRD